MRANAPGGIYRRLWRKLSLDGVAARCRLGGGGKTDGFGQIDGVRLTLRSFMAAEGSIVHGYSCNFRITAASHLAIANMKVQR